MNKKIRGFTLIEMSVVLVIVGLIVGGIILGQSLIRQSQVSGTLADEQQYMHAMVQFQQKYNAMPGDFANATTYWGASGGSAATDNYTYTCYEAQAGTQASTATCNGDGNGQIAPGVNFSGLSYTNQDGGEQFNVWKHLSNAGMIPGSYSGSNPTGGAVPGVNVPTSRLSASILTVSYVGNSSAPGWEDGAVFFPGNYGHVINVSSVGQTSYIYPLFTTAEALAIDTKYDDGMPATGNVMSYLPVFPQSPNCATSSTPSAAQYNVSATGPQCALLFITGF